MEAEREKQSDRERCRERETLGAFRLRFRTVSEWVENQTASVPVLKLSVKAPERERKRKRQRERERGVI